MKEETNFIITLVIGFIVGALVVMVFASVTMKPKRDIIKHGCAEYHNTTAKFQWIKKK